MIWRFPEIGVPPVITNFRLGFSLINQPFLDTPIDENHMKLSQVHVHRAVNLPKRDLSGSRVPQMKENRPC